MLRGAMARHRVRAQALVLRYERMLSWLPTAYQKDRALDLLWCRRGTPFTLSTRPGTIGLVQRLARHVVRVPWELRQPHLYRGAPYTGWPDVLERPLLRGFPF